jgi:hypothetical protein
LNRLAKLNIKGRGGDEEANQIVADWITCAVANWELMVGWAIVWVTAHLVMVLGVGGLLGSRGVPTLVLLVVEVIPGVSVGLYTVKLGISISAVLRTAKAVGAAERQGIPAPRWTKRRGFLMKLMIASDFDLALPITVTLLASMSWLIFSRAS